MPMRDGGRAYARAARAILLRMAEVLPRYLVRAGYAYGEYADCTPCGRRADQQSADG